MSLFYQVECFDVTYTNITCSSDPQFVANSSCAIRQVNNTLTTLSIDIFILPPNELNDVTVSTSE